MCAVKWPFALWATKMVRPAEDGERVMPFANLKPWVRAGEQWVGEEEGGQYATLPPPKDHF